MLASIINSIFVKSTLNEVIDTHIQAVLTVYLEIWTYILGLSTLLICAIQYFYLEKRLKYFERIL
jgi:cytochrome c oxidase subunit IV